MKLSSIFLAAALVVACNDKTTDAEPAPARPSAEPTASAEVEEPKEIPEVVAIRAGTWKDPAGEKDVPLVETSLAPCYGFKGYSMKLPEGQKVTTLQGARACHIVFGKADGGFQMAVFTDQVKVPFMSQTRADLKDVGEKLFDEEDAFLYEVGEKDDKELVGWFAKKIGPHNVRCNAIVSQGNKAPSFAFQRAVLELCRTITHTEP